MRALDQLHQLARTHELDVTLTVRTSGAELGLALTPEARRRGVPSLRRYAPMAEVSGGRVAEAAELLLADLTRTPPRRGPRTPDGMS